jgi:hypothetical protein
MHRSIMIILILGVVVEVHNQPTPDGDPTRKVAGAFGGGGGCAKSFGARYT